MIGFNLSTAGVTPLRGRSELLPAGGYKAEITSIDASKKGKKNQALGVWHIGVVLTEPGFEGTERMLYMTVPEAGNGMSDKANLMAQRRWVTTLHSIGFTKEQLEGQKSIAVTPALFNSARSCFILVEHETQPSNDPLTGQPILLPNGQQRTHLNERINFCVAEDYKKLQVKPGAGAAAQSTAAFVPGAQSGFVPQNAPQGAPQGYAPQGYAAPAQSWSPQGSVATGVQSGFVPGAQAGYAPGAQGSLPGAQGAVPNGPGGFVPPGTGAPAGSGIAGVMGPRPF